MSTVQLRKQAKARIDEAPAKAVKAALDYLEYLIEHGTRPPLSQRLKGADREYRAGGGTPVAHLKRKYRRV